LKPEAALRALTLSTAEILGISEQLGSIEPGKIANLVIADGDIFNEKTKVKMVFVDGRRYEVHEPSRPTDPPSFNLTGKWSLTVNSPDGGVQATAELNMAQDGTLTGTVIGHFGTSEITTGYVSGNRFSFSVIVALPSGSVN